METAIYQLDELSAILGMLRRAAVDYLSGSLIEDYNVELDRLCPPIWELNQQEIDFAAVPS